MNRSEFRIPEEKTQEVFTLAAQLYAKHNQSYSVKELKNKRPVLKDWNPRVETGGLH
jgi:hypothetical protein